MTFQKIDNSTPWPSIIKGMEQNLIFFNESREIKKEDFERIKTMTSITNLRKGQIYPWDTLNEFDIDSLIVKHMSIMEKREWLEVNKPKELKEFFAEEK